MIQDKQLVQAVSRIIQRAERQGDIEKTIASFVDVGVLPQLDNRNHQIIYGRRGTGKTHVLKVLGAQIEKRPNHAVVYIDCRTLGSSTQFSDTGEPINRRCLALFRDLLEPIYSRLLEYIVYEPSQQAEKALEEVGVFGRAISDHVTLYKETGVTVRMSDSTTSTHSAKIGVHSSTGVGADIGQSVDDAVESEATRSYNVESYDKVFFPEIFGSLTRTLDYASVELAILIDEWSSLPLDIQPYLAEFVKRTLLPVQRVTIKIASLEYRSRFAENFDSRLVGFELGADISVSLDLDDYFVYDRNPELLTNTYADILHRHIQIELDDGYLDDTFKIQSGKELATLMFTQLETFQELARASEGVVRDLMYICHLAFFDSHRRQRETIDRKSIIDAARKWFEQDKLDQLDDKMQDALRRIIENVIGRKRARSFMVQREFERHPMIQKLFDARVIHYVQRGYADKDNPGIRYNIYTLDYGTYVDLIGTSKEPQLAMFELEEIVDVRPTEIVVPFDDKRSIRRIIVDAKLLDASYDDSSAYSRN